MSDIKADVINEALSIVTGARRSAYGTPEDNFKRICDLWNVQRVNTGRPADLEPKDVAIFMVLMKLARLSESPDHRDSMVDTIGYMATYAEMTLPPPAE